MDSEKKCSQSHDMSLDFCLLFCFSTLDKFVFPLAIPVNKPEKSKLKTTEAKTDSSGLIDHLQNHRKLPVFDRSQSELLPEPLSTKAERKNQIPNRSTISLEEKKTQGETTQVDQAKMDMFIKACAVAQMKLRSILS